MGLGRRHLVRIVGLFEKSGGSLRRSHRLGLDLVVSKRREARERRRREDASLPLASFLHRHRTLRRLWRGKEELAGSVCLAGWRD